MGPFLPSPGTVLGSEGSKIWLFVGQNKASVAGWFQGGYPTWEVFHEPFHMPMHRTTLFRPTFAPSRHLCGPGVVQNIAIFELKSGPYGGTFSGWGVPPGN